MKNIKFRAFAHGVNEMTFFDNVIFATSELSEGKAWGLFFPSANGKVFLCAHSEPMQSTGMADKNGKQIFEGDILATLHFLDVEGWHYLHHIVEWSDKYSGWFCRSTGSKGGNDDNIQFWVYAKKEFEVVGNIYQLPKLLAEHYNVELSGSPGLSASPVPTSC